MTSLSYPSKVFLIKKFRLIKNLQQSKFLDLHKSFRKKIRVNRKKYKRFNKKNQMSKRQREYKKFRRKIRKSKKKKFKRWNLEEAKITNLKPKSSWNIWLNIILVKTSISIEIKVYLIKTMILTTSIIFHGKSR